MQFSTIVIVVAILAIGVVDGQSSSLFNLPIPEMPSFKNHFNPAQSRMTNVGDCMAIPLPNPLNLDISVCGHAASFLSDGCIRINRLPYGYSLSICAANANANNGRPQQKLPPNCIPFNIPMGYKAIICPP
ncbi:hypothetical protein DERF_014026 [Dermatophagoides farinae]|uniref:Uncharacterized protein n=1 Tax=Dermatophagoides farinae TaxID=6954 RepID=A0A922HKS2_DERFA|nr:hypothetical protein DERF_014026 [Dermatophagoides farinae]